MQRAYVLTILPPVTALTVGLPAQRAIAQRFSALARTRNGPMSDVSRLSGEERKLDFGAVRSVEDPEETSPGRGTSRGEIRDPLLSDADRFYRGGSSFSAKSSPISIRWSLNLERTLRHL